MYDLGMARQSEHGTQGIIPDRLRDLLQQKKMSAAELARRTGIDKSTISLIMNGRRKAVTSVTAMKIADELNVSVDHLVGNSDVAEPTSLMLGELLVELTQVARKLPPSKQRDLLAIARTYQEQIEEARHDRTRFMEDILSLVREYGGEISEDRLIDFMEASSTAPTGSLPDGTEARGPNLLPDDLLPDDEKEPPQGGE